MNYNSNIKKGFTLIELLVVIGILAILATVVVLVLNPAELFAQARDSQRISDLAALQSALGLYLSTFSPAALGADASCYVHIAGTAANCGGRHLGVTVVNTGRSPDGTGWIPVDLRNTSGGSPLSQLPIDPTNTTTYFYSYAAFGNATFEINANMESDRYENTGSSDVESVDGGTLADIYEVGNDPGLNL